MSNLSLRLLKSIYYHPHKILVILSLVLTASLQAQNKTYPVFVNTGHPSQDSANYRAALKSYEDWKISLPHTPQRTNATPALNAHTRNMSREAIAPPVSNCMIQRDNTWSVLPGNDDGSTPVINLPFTFEMYGTNYNQVYINNNGNLTFNSSYGTFTSTGFPFNVPMVAAFWADVDTRNTCAPGSGLVYYKLESTHLIVTWENVGYYSEHCDKMNTFQIVIGTINDPLIGAGRNVLFNYGNMGWTTGDVSGGSNGFGGTPATVGVNSGDGTNYIQVGRFDHAGTDYNGGGSSNGVDYLDNKCFSFNVTSSQNIPPSFSGLPANNTVNLNVGQTANFTIQAIGPEVGQNVTSVLNLNGLCGITQSITNGTVSTTNLGITGQLCNVGTHTITLTATDNGTPVRSTDVTLTINVTNPNTNNYYSKAAGNLSDVATWGLNPDGSGTNPPDFGSGKIFNLANRGAVYMMTADWTVGGTINIPGGSELQINGHTLSEATLAGTGTLTGSSTSNLVATGISTLNFSGTGNSLNSLTVNNGGTATLGNALSLIGPLNIQNGNLVTAGFLTLKSTATTTSIVTPVTGTISGNTTVERFIPARRAWRMINAPVTGPQTVNQSFQEGAVNPTPTSIVNPHPGYGTDITGGTISNGFDQCPGCNPSIQWYSNAQNRWMALPNTNTTQVGNMPFMLFIRGDRSINLSLLTSARPVNTTLRATGNLLVGNQSFAVNASGFTVVPNPFQSPVNYATITRSSSVQNNFYLWDPKLGGLNGVGAYVTVSGNGEGYDVTPAPASPETQYIQPWQSFMVHTTGTPGTITIKESDKVSSPINNVYRAAVVNNLSVPGANNAQRQQQLRITLNAMNPDNSTSVLDEALVSYGAGFSNAVDGMDAVKLPNINENLSILRQNTELAIERRALNSSDTISLRMTNINAGNYVLQLAPLNLESTGLNGFVEDNYLHTVTPMQLTGSTQLSFTVSEEPLSKADNRFLVILTKGMLQNINNRKGIVAFPNPIVGDVINMDFTGQQKGTYHVELVNNAGQVIYSSNLYHAEGRAIESIHIGRRLAAGIYRLQIVGNQSRSNIQIMSN